MISRDLKQPRNLKQFVSGSPGKLESDPDYLIGLGARVKEVRGGMSQEEFAEAHNVHVNTLRRYESGERAPEPAFLTSLTKRFSTLNPVWLLIGQGTRVRPEILAEASEQERAAYFATSQDEEKVAFDRIVGAMSKIASPVSAQHHVAQDRVGYAYIPLYDVKAAAGRGRVVDGEQIIDALAFKEDWIRQELRTSPADLRLIYVEGDSMEPDLRAGDIILIDHTDTSARREGIYVIRMDGALLVKQLQRLPGSTVKVISRNPAYEPFTVTASEIEDTSSFAVVGRVVWACRRY